MKHTHTLTPRNLFAAAACLLAMHSIAQNTGDYRSAGSGDWSAASTWQIFDGSSFVAAPSAPESSDGVITIRANHIVTQSGNITVDQVVVQVGGSLIHNGGVLTLLDGTGTDLSVEGTWSMSGGTLAGPGTAQASNGGSFNWSGGVLGTTAVVTIEVGASATFNGAGQLAAAGTINNSGVVTMLGGGISGGPNQPATFNNLPNAVVDLNGWTTNANPWAMVTNNQGTFNKNNGTVLFTFGNDFSAKAFNNLAGGTLNVATGECVFNVPTTNEGSMTGGPGSLIKVDGGSGGGFFTNQPGRTVSTAFQLASSNLTLNAPLTLGTFTVSGGGVNGPEAITIPSGGSFTWTGGVLGTTTAVNIEAGASATFNGAGQLAAAGTINNAGVVTMLGGGISGGQNQPATFNNLPNAVVELNGWTTSATPWAMVTNNQGTFNKNNGTVPFIFGNDFSGKAFNNLTGGVLNVATGECVFSVPTFNEGSMTGGGSSLIKVDGNASGGFFTNQPGGTVSTAFHLVSGNLNLNAALTLGTFIVSGGVINGPEAITIPSGGSFNWTGGLMVTTAVINIGAGASATFNGPGQLEARGTINNAGTVTMLGGGISGGPNLPATFNNLPDAVVELNGWTTSVTPWAMVTNNQGTFNKNNGTELFTFGNDFSGKSFTNLAGAVVNVNSGTLAFNLPFPLQNGTFNVASGTTLTGAEPFNFAGPTIVNNGSITTPVLRYQGTSAQQLNGSGSITHLAIDNATGVDLGGDQTVTSVLTLTTGQLRLGANDLFVENNAVGAVSGGNASSWVVNDGSGSLHRQVNGSSYLFPVGTDSYTPLTLSQTNGAQDRFSVRVQDGVSTEYSAPGVAGGTSISSDIVGRTWVVSEEVTGGNEADVTLQWNGADELSLFGRNACTVSNYSGSDWNIGPLAAAAGGEPFTRTLSGITAFRELCVADGDAPLNDVNTGLSDRTNSDLKVFPVPASDVLQVTAPDGNSIIQVTLIDGTGRRIETRSTVNLDRSILDVSGLLSGTYVLELIDDRDQVMRTQVIIAH